MVVLLLVAGIGFILAGVAAIGFGVPINEFGFGNTLIVAGTVSVCTGMLLLGLWTAVRELKNIARRLGPGAAVESNAEIRSAPTLATPRSQAADDGGFLFSGDRPGTDRAENAEPGAPSSAPPWHGEDAPRDRTQDDATPAGAEAAPAVKPRRNLLFSSSSRKERERTQARTPDSSTADPHPEPASTPPAPESAEPPPASFDDAWPKPERSRPADVAPPRRQGRTPSGFVEPGQATGGADRYPPAVRTEDPTQVTVLKSGVVDGMAYSLYSDGSIEAQMPEGMMRFASIDELRAHLDHRS
jgi:hypothetical protein